MEQDVASNSITLTEPAAELTSVKTVENVGDPQNFTPLGEAIMPKVFREALDKIEKRKEANRLAREAPDDNEEPADTIQILQPVIYEDGNGEQKDATEQIQSTMNHLSQTTSPEVGTERVQLLQDIVDKMTSGLDIQARVVIMNRGKDPSAFVFPDGTICISQSLINKLGSLDEIAAVMAHEVNHLRFQTFQNQQKAPGLIPGVDQFGIGWTHELASDTATPELLVKAGFNSGAFSSAIKRIGAENQRGLVHQSATARSAQVKFVHLAEDFATSDQTHTPVPELLVRDFGYTNEDILYKFAGIYDKSEDPVGFLSKLSKRDLLSSLEKHFAHPMRNEKSSHRVGLTAFYELIGQRLDTAGYERKDIDLFKMFLDAQQYGVREQKMFLSFFPSANDVISAVRRVDAFGTDQFGQMHMALFDSDKDITADQFLKYIQHRIVASEHNDSQHAGALPFTDSEFDELVDAIDEEIKNVSKDPAYSRFWSWRDGSVPDLIYTYAKSRFAGSFRQFRHIDQAEVRKFFQKYADKGIRLIGFSRNDAINRSQLKGMSGSTVTYHDKPVKQSNTENMDQFQDIFIDVFLKPEESGTQTMSADSLRSRLRGLGRDLTIHSKLAELISDMDRDGSPGPLSRDELAQLFLDELGDRDYECKFNFLRKQQGGTTSPVELPRMEREKMSRLYKMHLQLSSLLLVYHGERTPVFFDKAKGLFENNREDIESLDLYELLNLFHGLGTTNVNLFSESTPGSIAKAVVNQKDIKPTQELLDLYPLQLIHEKANALPIETVDDLLATLDSLNSELFFNNPNLQGKGTIQMFSEGKFYSDDILTVIAGDKIRRQFNVLLASDLPDQQLQGLKTYLTSYYPVGPRRDLYASKIDNRVMRSSTLTFPEKIAYLQNNFDSCGVEGLVILADQITTFEDFKTFKSEMSPRLEAYLGANNRSSQIASADVVSALFADKYELLFESASENPVTKKHVTTKRAGTWIGQTLLERRYGFETKYIYNPDSNTIRPEKGHGLGTSSFADLITKAQSLGQGERLSIALKALTESSGALHNEHSRKRFAGFLIEALQLPEGFVQTAVRSAITNVEPDTLSLPAAQLAAPLLFRALDVSAIDIAGLHKAPRLNYDVEYPEGELNKYYKFPYNITRTIGDKLAKKDRVHDIVPTQGKLRELLSSETHEILDTSIEVDSPLGQVFNSVRGEYVESLDLLDTLLLDTPNAEKKEVESGLDAATEAIIRSIESSGPIGVRSLQLATQLQDFSPEVHRRLSQSLDSNAGLNKLLFWHNLDKFVESDPEIGDFVRNRLIRVGGYMGGGSLNTTYEAFIRTDDGGEKRVALKMLSPNTKSVIGETYDAATTTLRAVERDSPQYAAQARTSLMLIDLSNQWCLADINDSHFHEDDALYQRSVTGVDTTAEGVRIFIPEIELHNYRLKSEDAVSGNTVNKLLSDSTVDGEFKRRIVKALGKLFVHEVTVPITDEAGSSVYLIRSDPHTGNQVVDTSNPQELAMGIIDRHMYLKMTHEDMDVAHAFIRGQGREGAQLLLDRIMVHNKVTDERVKNTILLQLVKGRLRQRVNGKQDEMQLVQILSRECAKRNLDIPLQMRLLLKNIESVRQLTSEYGIDLSQMLDGQGGQNFTQLP